MKHVMVIFSLLSAFLTLESRAIDLVQACDEHRTTETERFYTEFAPLVVAEFKTRFLTMGAVDRTAFFAVAEAHRKMVQFYDDHRALFEAWDKAYNDSATCHQIESLGEGMLIGVQPNAPDKYGQLKNLRKRMKEARQCSAKGEATLQDIGKKFLPLELDWSGPLGAYKISIALLKDMFKRNDSEFTEARCDQGLCAMFPKFSSTEWPLSEALPPELEFMTYPLTVRIRYDSTSPMRLVTPHLNPEDRDGLAQAEFEWNLDNPDFVHVEYKSASEKLSDKCNNQTKLPEEFYSRDIFMPEIAEIHRAYKARTEKEN